MTDKTYGPDNLTIDQMHSNRDDAKVAGHSHYFLEESCKRGHKAPRYTSSTVCVECRKIYYEYVRCFVENLLILTLARNPHQC